MSKIICDVCGTSYLESATQCPICGCVRPADAAIEVDGKETKYTRRENYTYVKGGRFSKANVQKRNQGLLVDNADTVTNADTESQPKGNKSDKGLVIAVCALLLAIIAVVVYIALHFFVPGGDSGNDPINPQGNGTSQTSSATTVATDHIEIPCDEIVLSQMEVTLNNVGEAFSLSVSLKPEDATDELHFASDDESVASVSDDGVITVVGAGETTVTVTCGEAIAQCHVICDIAENDTDETIAPTISAGEYKAPYRLSDSDGDVSIVVGQTFQLKLLDANGEIIPVTWSPTIADICKIEGNSVTGLEKGKIELSATYDGETFTCIVRVR